MTPKCFAFAMLLLSGILAFGNLPGISADCNRYQIPPIVQYCQDFIHKEGPEIPPSPECCSFLIDADIPCLCNYITPPVEALMSVEKAIYIARTCGCTVPAGIKCGSYFVPPILTPPADPAPPQFPPAPAPAPVA